MEKFNYLNQQAGDASKYKTGIEKIDTLSQQKITDLFQKYLTKSGDMDINELAYNLEPELNNILQGDAAAKNKLDEETKKIQALSAKNKNINTAALQNDVLTRVGDMYLQDDGKGQLNYRPLDQINHNQDITGDLIGGQDAYKYSMGAENLMKDIQNIPGDERNVFMKNPNNSITTYTGKLTPFKRMVGDPDAGGFVKQEPKFEIASDDHNTVTDAKGNALKVLPKDIFDQNIYNSDENRLQFDYLWNNYKNQAGIKTTPQSEETLKRAFAYKLVEQNDKSEIYPKTIQHLPPQPRISVSTGGSGEPNINDVYAEISKEANSPDRPHHGVPLNELSSTAQSVILKYARDITADNDIKQDDIYVQKEKDGTLSIRGATTKQLIGSLNFKDANLPLNKTVKEKQAVLQKAQEQPKQPAANKTYNYNGKTYTPEQIKKGADHYGISVEDYLKQLGIQ